MLHMARLRRKGAYAPLRGGPVLKQGVDALRTPATPAGGIIWSGRYRRPYRRLGGGKEALRGKTRVISWRRITGPSWQKIDKQPYLPSGESLGAAL